MKPNRTLPLALSLAVLAALVSGCVDELDTGFEPPPVEEGAWTDPAAGGHPLADGTEEGVFDSIVHPVRGRIDLTISTTDPLLPNADVELDIRGVARSRSTAARWC